MGLFHQSKESVPQQGESSKSYFVSKGEQERRNDIWNKLVSEESKATKRPGIENWKNSFNHTIYKNLDDSKREVFWRTGDSHEKGWEEKETYLENTLTWWPQPKRQDIARQLLVITDGKGAEGGSDWDRWGKLIWGPAFSSWLDSLESKISRFFR